MSVWAATDIVPVNNLRSPHGVAFGHGMICFNTLFWNCYSFKRKSNGLIDPRVRQRPDYAPKRGWQTALTALDVMHLGIRGSGLLEDLSARLVPPPVGRATRTPKVQEAIHRLRCKPTEHCRGRANPNAASLPRETYVWSTKQNQAEGWSKQTNTPKVMGKQTTTKQQRDHPRPVRTPRPPTSGQRYCQWTSRSGLSRGGYRLPVSDHLCQRTHRFRRKTISLSRHYQTTWVKEQVPRQT